VLEKFIPQLLARQPLSDAQVIEAVEALVDEAVPAATKADFLTHLARKGETVGEIAAFARALRERALAPPLDPETRAGEILDVCGTGGDRAGTFNVSTCVALICAAAGVPVAKHGNRAVTSQAGSADVLEALGVRIELSPAEAARSLREHRFAFFFAPQFHPAFRHIAPARRLCAERGQRTIFNLLGPLLNPARPTAQLIGVPRPELCAPVAQVLQSLGVRRGMVVCGQADAAAATHLDELSTLGGNTLAEFQEGGEVTCATLSPDALPVSRAELADLRGGDRRANAEILRRILAGIERGPKRDLVLLNAAAALVVANRADSLQGGWELASRTIDEGRAAAKLQELSGA
jgi:anthranilate phosphoribosyltransferase